MDENLIESRILLQNVLAMKYISEIPIVGQLWKLFSFQFCPKFLLAQAGKTMLIIKIIDFFLRDNTSVIKNTSFFFKLNLFKIGNFCLLIQGQWDKATMFYESTLGLQSSFTAAKQRLKKIKCRFVMQRPENQSGKITRP